MALPGRMPKDVKLGRGLTAEWTEIPNTPYSGPSLDLPELEGGWYREVEQWWEITRAMPHCVLWSQMDWQYALYTAYMWQDWWKNFHSERTVFANKSTEIRRREDQMGTTMEARRKLRIRYVDAEPVEDEKPEAPTGTGAKVTDIKSRRDRMTKSAAAAG